MVGHSGTYYNQAVILLLAPAAARTAAFTSASVDTQNYDALAIAVNVGATGDTLNATNRVELQVQESDDNITYTPAADSDLLKVVSGGQATGTFGLLNAAPAVNQVYMTGYRGNKRYVRVAGAFYGTTTSGTFIDALALAGRARNMPINA